MFGLSKTSNNPSPRAIRPAPAQSSQKEEISSIFDEAREFYKISTRLFGNRHCPAYMDHTSFEGSDTAESITHWLEVVSLWLEGKALFFPVGVKREHYEHLVDVLKTYLATLKRREEAGASINLKDEDPYSEICRKEALVTQKEIEEGLGKQKIFYVPLSYCGSVTGQGHAITAKCRLYPKVIEVLFLNVGEGAQLHPELQWSETARYLHFQSFPIQIEPKVLFGKRGEEVFTRLVRLQCDSGSGVVKPYSAEDIYGAFWLLGPVQSSFDSKPALRAKKPQLDSNCADMAATLLIKDVLIDLGYGKKEIQRFFCNEFLTNLVCYFNELSQSDSYQDEWLLMRAALEGFSTHILHLCSNSLKEKEVIFCRAILDQMFQKTASQLRLLREPLHPMPLDVEGDHYEKLDLKQLKHKKINIACDEIEKPTSFEINELKIPPPEIPSPEKLLETLELWNKTTNDLLASGQRKRACQFVYRMMLTLPIPDPEKEGYWDEISQEENIAILQEMAQLVRGVLSRVSEEFPSFYKTVFILHTGFAIADKLARKNAKTLLDGFASPFFATYWKVHVKGFFSQQMDRLSNLFNAPNEPFDFMLLPLEVLNNRWFAIRQYFETHLARSKYTLFALTEDHVNIQEGVEELSRSFSLSPLSPTAKHLHYIKQFLPAHHNPLQLENYLTELWLNEKGQLPQEYEILYFFAYYSWAFFTTNRQHLALPPSDIKIARQHGEYITFPADIALKYAYYGDSLPTLGLGENATYSFTQVKKKGRQKNENESMCSEIPKELSYEKCLTKKHYRYWSRIFSTPSLQISSTLNWMQHNFGMIVQKYYQHLIEIALFDPGMLTKKIKEDPHIIFNLRDCIKRGIAFYNSSNPNTSALLFFIRLGICCESFVENPDLKDYEELLLTGKESEKNPWHFYNLLLLLYQLGLPRGHDSLKEMIKAQFWVALFAKKNESCREEDLERNQFPKSTHWSWQEIEWSSDRYQQSLIEAFQIKNWVEELSNELALLCSLSVESRAKAQFPEIHFGVYTFNVEKTTIVRNRSQQLVPVRMEKRHNLLWIDDDTFVSFEDSLKFVKDDGKLTISKQFSILDVGEHWYQKISIEGEGNPLLNHALFKKKYDLWLREGSFDLLLLSEVDYLRYLVLENGTICKVTKDGLLYLLDWKQTEELNHFFTILGSDSEVCCFAKPGCSRIEEMEFLSLDLSFKGEDEKGKWRLRSTQFPQYCLRTEGSLEELNHFRGAIILENELNTAIIIPKRAIEKVDSDFTTQVYLAADAQSVGSYFFFHLDEQAGLLVSDDPLANLFLSLLFAMQRDYKKALSYLPKAAAFRYFMQDRALRELFENFKNLKEHSPESLAFYLRLGLLLFENELQLLQAGFEKNTTSKNEEPDEDIFIWLGQMYVKYIRILSTKEESRIPSYIRLNREEEAFFLSQLKSHLSKAQELHYKKFELDSMVEQGIRKLLPNVFWLPIFQLREQLLQHQGNTYSFKIPVREYSSCLPEYQIVPMISRHYIDSQDWPQLKVMPEKCPDFVRLSLEEIKKYFMLLYEKVKKKTIEAELNILYLLRSDEMLLGKSTHFYASLLLYVHTYPETFKDLTFGNDPAENVRIFPTILERSTSVLSNLWKAKTSISKTTSNTIIFNYQASANLKLPPQPKLQPLSWQFSSQDIQRFVQVRNSLFEYFLQNGLTLTKMPMVKEGHHSTFEDITVETTTEEKLVNALETGNARLLNPKYGKATYTLTVSREEFFKRAIHYLENLKKKLAKIKKSAEKCVNACPDIEFRIGLRKQTRDLPKLQIEGILSDAYSQTDPMVIRRANPSLSPENVYKGLRKTIEYHLLRVHLFQLKKAIKELERLDIQGFGEAIANYGTIDPSNEPEIILFQSRMGKTLHEKQMALMEWHVKTTGKVSLFAAPAGGGKTTVFQPIAMQRIKRLGGVAASVSPKPLYLVDRDGLASVAQHAHALDIAVLEVSLDVPLNAADFQRIYEELIRCSMKGLKITPEAYYALDLKYQLLLDKGNDLESIKWVSLILDHLGSKVTALIDECRVNLSPFTQAKIGIGLPMPLPSLDRKVFLAIYENLTSPEILLEDKRLMDAVVSLPANLQATMEESDLLSVKKAALNALIDHPLFDIPKGNKEDVLAYWNGHREEPAWLGSEQQEKAIELVKIYFEIFFVSAMNLVGKMKHVRSLKAAEQIHVPARKKQATGAYFEEVHVTVIATIHGLLQEGLNQASMTNLIDLLEEEHLEEAGSSDRISPIEEMFRNWMGDQNLRLKDFFSPNAKQMGILIAKLSKCREAIFWYLEKHVLKQATYCPEQLIVTPMHFLHAFQRAVLFSADPGPQEIYGLHDPKQVKIDRTFSAHVVHQISDPQNEMILTLPLFQRPLELFKWLLTNAPDLYKTLSMLADGGMLRDFSTRKIARDFFIFLETEKLPVIYDGIILFEDSLGKATEGELQLWLRGWRAPKVLKGHDIIEAIAILGLRWENLNLLTLIDPSHTTGANIKQKEGTTALILLAEEFSLGDGIQTVMRMRDFLINQNVVWGLLAALKIKIESKMQEIVNPKVLRIWMLKNEALRIDKELPLGAFQKIAYFVEKPARDALHKHLHDPAKQVAVWKRYRKGFVKNMDPDLIKRFKQKPIMQNAKAVLLAYAEHCYNSFGYSTKWKDASSVHKSILPEIKAVEERIPLLSIRASHDLMQQSHMHVSQQQQVEMDQVQTYHVNLSPSLLENLPAHISIEKPGFVLHLSEYSREAREVFQSEGLTKRFWFTLNALHTAETGIMPLGETYLKPVQYILVVLEKGTWSAFALSDFEANTFQEQLLTYSRGEERQIALLNVYGALIQNGRGTFAFSDEELNVQFVQDVVIDAGLSQCELYHPERFLKRITTWEDFWPMWNRMKSWQTLPQELHTAYIERLVPNHFKIEKEKETEKPKKGFFSWFL